MTPFGPADTSAPRSYTLRGVALLAAASMVAAISLLAMPLSGQAATTAASRPLAMVPTIAAGRLAPQGCTASTTPTGTTDTCDLYAMAGTTSVLGAPIPIWGFSTTGAVGTATTPGPLLVVNQGDIVTITLHNELAGQQVSLAFPGQPTSAFSAGLSTQATEAGVATGSTATYTFTADRAGTFIYEAGHTANGTRQVAMGLAGALVVRPADGSAYGPPSAGSPSTVYDDDAVVVLSEIDPAFNAAPATFNMRKFAPAYRLINGKPYPSTDPISTDQGHKVLLRYVNIGSQEHSMSLLGADQTQVGQNGRALKYAETGVAMAVQPGATADTLVTMPSGPESKVTLYEAAGRLDNNGQTTADPLSFAFGGMLTFLDTAAPPPSTDIVGPVSSHVSATPNPSNGLSAVTVTADLSDVTTPSTAIPDTSFGNPLVDRTYATDYPTGVGTLAPVLVVLPNAKLPTGALQSFQTWNQGTPGASPTPSAGNIFHAYVLRPTPGVANKYTVIYDSGVQTVPAPTNPTGEVATFPVSPAVGVAANDVIGFYGEGIPVDILPAGTVPSDILSYVAPVAPAMNQTFTLGVDTDFPIYPQERTYSFAATVAPRAVVDQAELVIDDAVTTGPGFGTPMTGAFGSVNVAGATGTITTAVLDGLAAGKHTVFVRAHDTAGNWGVVGAVIFNLPKTGPQTTNGSATPSPANGTLGVAISATGDDRAGGGTITEAEYFVNAADTPPTPADYGTGTGMTLNRIAAVVAEDATIPAATVLGLGEGMHHVFVHSKSSLGVWGPPLDISLPVDLTDPAVEAASVGPNPTNGVMTDKAHPGYLTVSARITDKDAGGALQNAVTHAEGFLDAVGADGSGFQMIPVDGAMDSTTEDVYGLIPISQIRSLSNGTHHVFVHGKDAAGNWGGIPLYAIELTVDKTAPVLGTVVGTPNPTNGVADLTLTAPVSEATIGGAEFWLGTTDPGVGKATSVVFSIVGGNVVATVPLAGIAPAAQRFNLRVKDTAGSWSNAVFTTVTVTRPNAIFANGFDLAISPFGWSSITGALSVTSAAGIPAGVTNLGLQATLAGGASNGPRYVTDLTPIAETGYHASFDLNANTLTSGTNAGSVLTLFEGRTANAQVFAVQFHRTLGVAGANQIRVVFPRSTDGTFTGPWVSLPAGNHSIRVDWIAGPATGVNPGSLRLLLDGVSVTYQTGNTGTRRVELARLGLTAGVTSTMTGTAYFDSFASTRFTLP